MVSLPLGAVRLTQEFLRSDPPTAEEIGRMKQFIARELRRAGKKIDATNANLVIATSGTAAALAEASSVLVKPGRGKAGGKTKAAGKRAPNTAPVRDVRRLADKLTKMNNVARGAMEGIGTKRSEIIVAGAHVYAELLEHYRLPGFRYSSLGLRDGILSQMLAEEDARTSAHQLLERERWEGVLELARRYGTDPKLMEPVRQHAEQLFHDLAGVHGLPEEYLLWLESAAVLRDVGKFLNYQGHHRHAQYIVANSELYGFTPEQRVVTSAIGRYLGKSRPAPEGRTMRDVPPTEHEWVRRAVVLLRLAVGLNQDRASDVLKVKTRVYPKRVILELYPGRTGAELELWSLRKEADYFREVFRRDLLVTLP
jgi:exopolyphosphatase/guanosine-5'-triphosphate,3'-diphosphate pyrophosphatase